MSAWPDNLCLSCDVICPLHFLNFANQLWDKHDPRESHLWTSVLGQLSRSLAEDEVLAVDAGVKISDLQKAGITRYVVRLAENFTARRNFLSLYRGHGRHPVYGERIRPLARRYKDKTLPASAPDRVETWREAGREMRAEIWDDLVLPDVTPDPQAATFQVLAIYDPLFAHP